MKSSRTIACLLVFCFVLGTGIQFAQTLGLSVRIAAANASDSEPQDLPVDSGDDFACLEGEDTEGSEDPCLHGCTTCVRGAHFAPAGILGYDSASHSPLSCSIYQLHKLRI